MCGYFCTGFIDFMTKGNSLLNYTNLFSPSEYFKYFQLLKTKLDCCRSHVWVLHPLNLAT